MEKKSGKLNRKYYPLLIVLTALLLVTCALGGVFAKYLQEYDNEGEVGAAEFYFESDILTEEGATYTLLAGTDSISFVLKNYADDLRYSEVDITCTIEKEGDGTLSATSVNLTNGQKDDETITLSGMENGKTYTVTVTGDGGYKKVLKATFTVGTVNAGFYKHVDASNDAYVLLTVWTVNQANENTVTITIPTGLIPDRTDPALEFNEVSNNSFTAAFGANESNVYRFFKTDAYEGGDFTVKMSEKEADNSIPA